MLIESKADAMYNGKRRIYKYSTGDSPSTFPTDVAAGSEIIDITTKTMYIFDGASWLIVGATTRLTSNNK